MRVRKLLAIIALVVSLGNLVVFWALRPIWYFINKDVAGSGQAPIAWIIFALMALSLVYPIRALLRLRSGPKPPPSLPALSVALFLSLVLGGLDGFLVGQLGSSEKLLGRNIAGLLPEAPAPLSFTAGPVFEGLPEGRSAVLWATNRPASGWVEAADGGRLWEEEDGLRTADRRVHHLVLPRAPDAPLAAGGRQVFNLYENWASLGAEKVSAYTTPRSARPDGSRTFLFLPDVHEDAEVYRRFLGDPADDFVVLGGDNLTSVDSEPHVAVSLLGPLARGAAGAPFYFVRGNHETRGPGARHLAGWLALAEGQYYYSFRQGDLWAVVLDSGEDKADDHPEYGGLVDFSRYLEEETAWLRALADRGAPADAVWRVAFVHMPPDEAGGPDDGSPYAERVAEWTTLLSRLGIQAVFSGHTHQARITRPEARGSFPVVVGAGPYGRPDDYRAVRVTSTDRAMAISLIGSDGFIEDSLTIERAEGR